MTRRDKRDKEALAAVKKMGIRLKWVADSVLPPSFLTPGKHKSFCLRATKNGKEVTSSCGYVDPTKRIRKNAEAFLALEILGRIS